MARTPMYTPTHTPTYTPIDTPTHIPINTSTCAPVCMPNITIIYACASLCNRMKFADREVYVLTRKVFIA